MYQIWAESMKYRWPYRRNQNPTLTCATCASFRVLLQWNTSYGFEHGTTENLSVAPVTWHNSYLHCVYKYCNTEQHLHHQNHWRNWIKCYRLPGVHEISNSPLWFTRFPVTTIIWSIFPTLLKCLWVVYKIWAESMKYRWPCRRNSNHHSFLCMFQGFVAVRYKLRFRAWDYWKPVRCPNHLAYFIFALRLKILQV